MADLPFVKLRGLLASVLLFFLRTILKLSREMSEAHSHSSIFGKVLSVTADGGFIFNPFWMHGQNELKMPFWGF